MKTTKTTAIKANVKETVKSSTPAIPSKKDLAIVKTPAKGKVAAAKTVEVSIEDQIKELELRLKEVPKTSDAKRNSITKKIEELKKQLPKAEKAPAVKSTRKVGDIHPNGLWVWKEIKDGKFDWRTIPSDKPKATTPKADKPAKTSTTKATKPVVKEPAKLTVFLKNRIKTEVTEKLSSNKSFQHALWAKQTDNKLFVEFKKVSKVTPEKLATIQAELVEQFKDLTVVFEVRKALN